MGFRVRIPLGSHTKFWDQLILKDFPKVLDYVWGNIGKTKAQPHCCDWECFLNFYQA